MSTPMPSPTFDRLDACLDRASEIASQLENEVDYLKGLARDIETHEQVGMIVACCESVKMNVASVVRDVAELPSIAVRALGAD